MSDQNVAKFKAKMMLTLLDTDTQKLADEIDEHRPVVSDIFNGNRKAIRVRRKVAAALCAKVNSLIIPEDQPSTGEPA